MLRFPYLDEPLAGLAFFDVLLLGADLMVELETNWKYPGTNA